MAILDVYMNGYLVGELTKSTTGSHLFKYEQQWLDTSSSRPISLSMPLRKQAFDILPHLKIPKRILPLRGEGRGFLRR